MKKITLLLASLLLFSAADARQFTLKNGDDEIAAGSTYSVPESQYEVYPGEVDVVPHFVLYSDAMTNSAKLTVKSLNGQTVQCCAGGACVAGTEITKDLVYTAAGQGVNLELEFFHFGNDLKDAGNVVVALDVTDSKYPAANVSYTIVMCGEDTGVEVIENNEVFRTVAGGFEYNLPGEAVVTLYNANGSVYGSYELSGNGVLSINELPAGVYIYTAVGRGVNVAGKVAK